MAKKRAYASAYTIIDCPTCPVHRIYLVVCQSKRLADGRKVQYRRCRLCKFKGKVVIQCKR